MPDAELLHRLERERGAHAFLLLELPRVLQLLHDRAPRCAARPHAQARALREDLEAYKLGVNAKMRDAWDAIRAAGRTFA